MAEPTPQNDILAPGSAATAALVVGGAVVTAGLMGFALRGPESSIHLAIALGLPIHLLFGGRGAQARPVHAHPHWAAGGAGESKGVAERT